MGSLQLKTQEGVIVQFEFSVGLTVASIFASLICIYLGLIISSRDRAYTKSKEGIKEMTFIDASELTIKEIKGTNFVFLALFKNPYPLVLGGFVTAAGIVVMHYIGMMAMVFEGTTSLDMGLVAASVIIAIVASIAAFWILFRLLALYPNNESFRLLGSIVMAVAINGMHYTGAGAANYDYNPNSPALSYDAHQTVSSSVAVFVVLTVAILFLFSISFSISVDLRTGIRTRSKVLSQIDTLVMEYNTFATRNLEKSLDIKQFIIKYEGILSGEKFDKDSNVSKAFFQVIKPSIQPKPPKQSPVHACSMSDTTITEQI